MSSARRPEHGGSAAPGALGVPHAAVEFDSLPAALPESPLAACPPHLLPCVQCAALNGRSALVCWSCEADLLAPRPQPAVLPPRGDGVVPVVHEVVAAERDDAADGRRGLHLVSRTGTPVSVLTVIEPVEPAFEVELPVLMSEVQEPPMPMRVPTSASASLKPGSRLRWPPPPMVALALAAVALVLVAASLRWRAPSQAASPPLTTTAATAARPSAALDRPFATPASVDEPDAARLSFPSREVVPEAPVANPAERVVVHGKAGASARPSGRAREGRSAIEPTVRARATAPAPCTSNMAALGFCTLEPPSAKE